MPTHGNLCRYDPNLVGCNAWKMASLKVYWAGLWAPCICIIFDILDIVSTIKMKTLDLVLLIWWSDAARNNSALHTIGIQQSQYWFWTWQSSVESYVGIRTYWYGISKVTFWKGQKSTIFCPADLNGAPQIEECCRGPAIEFLADFCTWTPLSPSCSLLDDLTLTLYWPIKRPITQGMVVNSF